jgi:hypothetical protein
LSAELSLNVLNDNTVGVRNLASLGCAEDLPNVIWQGLPRADSKQFCGLQQGADVLERDRVST